MIGIRKDGHMANKLRYTASSAQVESSHFVNPYHHVPTSPIQKENLSEVSRSTNLKLAQKL